MTSIKINGISELQKKLGSIAVQDVLRQPMKRSVYLLQRYMADYPTQRRGTSYVRTGTLGRRWDTRVRNVSGGLQGTIGNNTVYGPWVQSSRFQAGVHQGVWQTDQDAIKDNEDEIVSDFAAAIDKALG